MSHPKQETLERYAAGSLKAGAHVVVGLHLRSCRRCADRVDAIDQLGGALLGAAEPEPMAAGAWDRLEQRLEEAAPKPISFDRLVEDGRWLPVGRGLGFKSLRRYASKDECFYLIRARAGVALPSHGHTGAERLLVLEGAVLDSGATFGPGELVENEDRRQHRPEAASGATCTCIVASDGPLKASGGLRLLQPLLRI